MGDLIGRHACRYNVSVLVVLGLMLFGIGFFTDNTGIWVVGIALFVVGLATKCKKAINIEFGRDRRK